MNDLDPPPPPQPQDVPMTAIVEVTKATPVRNVPQLLQNEDDLTNTASDVAKTSREPQPNPLELLASNGVAPNTVQESDKNGLVNANPSPTDSGVDKHVDFAFENNDDPTGEAVIDVMEEENNQLPQFFY